LFGSLARSTDSTGLSGLRHNCPGTPVCITANPDHLTAKLMREARPMPGSQRFVVVFAAVTRELELFAPDAGAAWVWALVRSIMMPPSTVITAVW
jgi:hypothetical protein